tara:strand:- start:29 stop:253 length:225 start_codon:yes stop_codon:yes gene_type:complete
MEITIIVVLALLVFWYNYRYAMIHKELIRTRERLTVIMRKKESDYQSYRVHMVKMAEKVDGFTEVFKEWNSKKD